jgi:tripartite-type tricarboxylate transporter receptor subunit TctC
MANGEWRMAEGERMMSKLIARNWFNPTRFYLRHSPFAIRHGISAVLAAALVAPAAAQQYPAKPIRFVIPFAPAGANDVIGRMVGTKLGEVLGQPMIMDNRGGAGGSIGVELAAKSPPDGYTLVLGNIATLAVNPTLYTKLPYDPVKDLQPVSLAARSPQVLVVHPSLPVKSVKQLIALARAKPGSLVYASGGNGSGAHLTAEYFKLLTKTQMVHIPYKGLGPAYVDLLAGQIQVIFGGVTGVGPHIKSGRARPLGVTGAARVPAFPDIPTIAEAGVPGYDVTLWYGVLAPTGTPTAIVKRLHAAMATALQSPDLKERLFNSGAEPALSEPEAFRAFIKAEIGRWAPIIRASGARID